MLSAGNDPPCASSSSSSSSLRLRLTPMQTMNVDKLMKMSGAVRTGGKGSMRRKKKAVHKTTTDDKRLQSTLKRIRVNTIPTIEEVNIFKDDLVIQFVNLKEFEDLLPGIINQLEPDNLENLKRFVEHLQKQSPSTATAAKQDNDDVPDLVPGETFEAAADDENQAS